MKYVITKDQYKRVLLKYLNNFIGDIIVDEESFSRTHRQLKTSKGEEFGTIWISGPMTKGCKSELGIYSSFMRDLEDLIPSTRKKVFSEVMLEYFTLKTGIKSECIEFAYYTGKIDRAGNPVQKMYHFNTKNQ